MAMMNNAYQQYQKNIVTTSTPEELTLKLYNGLVRFLKQSIQGIDEKDIQKSNNFIIRAQEIITEFTCTLDLNYKVSESLLSMYEYMSKRLTEANLKKDKAIVEEVLGYAEDLRDTWAQAMKIAKQQIGRQQVVNK
jgi:flagellar protein FliS